MRENEEKNVIIPSLKVEENNSMHVLLKRPIYESEKNIDTSNFMNAFNETLDSIEKIKTFLVLLEMTPDNVFRLPNYRDSHNDIIYHILQEAKLNDDFLLYCYQKVLLCLQKYADERNLTGNIHIILGQSSSPRKGIVMVDGNEIFSFNLFDKTFGRKPKTLDSTSMTEKRLNDIEIELKQTKRKIEQGKSLLDNPYSIAEGIKDFFVVMFQKKRLQEMWQKNVSFNESLVEFLENEKKTLYESLPVIVEQHKFIEHWVSNLPPFFTEKGFERLPDGDYRNY